MPTSSSGNCKKNMGCKQYCFGTATRGWLLPQPNIVRRIFGHQIRDPNCFKRRHKITTKHFRRTVPRERHAVAIVSKRLGPRVDFVHKHPPNQNVDRRLVPAENQTLSVVRDNRNSVTYNDIAKGRSQSMVTSNPSRPSRVRCSIHFIALRSPSPYLETTKCVRIRWERKQQKRLT